MATLKILQFPSKWNGAVKCASAAYERDEKIVGKLVRCAKCGYDCDGVTRQVCSCHTYCNHCCRSYQYRPLPKTRNDTPPAGLTFHPYKVIRLSGSPMGDVVAPYVNVAVTNDEANLIMRDVRRKLNGYDSSNGLGVLHGLLVHSDNVDLLMKLLELGLDPELRSVHLSGAKVMLDNEEVGKDLNGGSALHFAVRFGRNKCFQALVDAGANLEAKTAAGAGIGDLETTDAMKEVVVSFLR
jgi:hypothetical protein